MPRNYISPSLTIKTHAMDFLSYSYLQSGQEQKHAKSSTTRTMSLGRARRIGPKIAPILLRGRPSSCIAGRKPLHCRFPPAQELAGHHILGPRHRCARTGDVARRGICRQGTHQLVAERESRARKHGYAVSNEKPSDLREAEAWLPLPKESPTKLFTRIARRRGPSGQERRRVRGHPRREMLADMLSELKRPAEALVNTRRTSRIHQIASMRSLGAARAAPSCRRRNGGAILLCRLASICSPGADSSRAGRSENLSRAEIAKHFRFPCWFRPDGKILRTSKGTVRGPPQSMKSMTAPSRRSWNPAKLAEVWSGHVVVYRVEMP